MPKKIKILIVFGGVKLDKRFLRYYLSHEFITLNHLTMTNNDNPSLGTLLVRAGLVIAGVTILEELFSDKHDTVNYKLKYRGKVVYHGICYEDRIDTRISEHECSGKCFDECIYDHVKPRRKAEELERKRIRRDRPKYNIQHN